MLQIYNATEEIALAQTYSQIRILHVGHQISNLPVEEPLLMEYLWSPVTESKAHIWPLDTNCMAFVVLYTSNENSMSGSY